MYRVVFTGAHQLCSCDLEWPDVSFTHYLKCTLYKIVFRGAHQLCSCERECSAASAAELDTSCFTPTSPGCEQSLGSWNRKGKKRKIDMRDEGERRSEKRNCRLLPSRIEVGSSSGVKGGR